MTEIVVDTDVISYGFRNDSRFTFSMAHMQGLRPLMSFMTSAEIGFGVVRRNWGQERRQRLEQYLSH
jgi:predicted nucleic acid-binding protein